MGDLDLDPDHGVAIDIFRSHDLSGGAKALWFVFVLFIPLIGVLVYLIARGGWMGDHGRPGSAVGPRVPQLHPASSVSLGLQPADPVNEVSSTGRYVAPMEPLVRNPASRMP